MKSIVIPSFAKMSLWSFDINNIDLSLASHRTLIIRADIKITSLFR